MEEFEKFIKKLSAEIKLKLPGFLAQRLMAPLGRKPVTDYINEKAPPKKSAVLILIYPDKKNFSPKIVLILRPEESRTHSNQISFPGGGLDERDKDLSETALRETEEEIGVDRKLISIIGELTPLYIPVSNYVVYPYVGFCNTALIFTVHPIEVKDIIEIGISELIATKNKTTAKRHIKIRNVEMEVPCYDHNGKIIWGATAMIISELAEIIRRIK